MSLVILIVLVLGVGAGYLMPADVSGFLDSASTYMLLLLLFSVGIDTGLNKAVFTRIRELGFRILLIPFGVALGSLCGGVVTAFLLSLPAKEGLAISAGLGWYSLSGVLITEAGNPVGGTIAFLANVFREMLTFVIVPFVASHLNYYSAIAPAGATSMDTTLGIISKNTNGTIAVLAFVNGIVCTLLVPLLVPLFISAIRRAYDLATAMEAKCYRGGEGRTKMKPLKYKKADGTAYIVILAYLALMIVVKICFV